MLVHTTVISPLVSTRAPECYLSVLVVIYTQKTEGSPYNLSQTITLLLKTLRQPQHQAPRAKGRFLTGDQIRAPRTHSPKHDLSSASHSFHRTWANFWDCSATSKGHFHQRTLRGLVEWPARLFSGAAFDSLPHLLKSLVKA